MAAPDENVLCISSFLPEERAPGVRAFSSTASSQNRRRTPSLEAGLFPFRLPFKGIVLILSYVANGVKADTERAVRSRHKSVELAPVLHSPLSTPSSIPPTAICRVERMCEKSVRLPGFIDLLGTFVHAEHCPSVRTVAFSFTGRRCEIRAVPT